MQNAPGRTILMIVGIIYLLFALILILVGVVLFTYNPQDGPSSMIQFFFGFFIWAFAIIPLVLGTLNIVFFKTPKMGLMFIIIGSIASVYQLYRFIELGLNGASFVPRFVIFAVLFIPAVLNILGGVQNYKAYLEIKKENYLPNYYYPTANDI